jgi:predicted component of type VI protein secretion system
MAFLLYIDDRPERLTYSFGDAPLVIGRGDDAGLRIPSDSVSTSHATIAWEEGYGYVLRDHSLNGTFVNGERVEACVLKHQDMIRINDYLFMVDLEDPLPASAASEEPKGEVTETEPEYPLHEPVESDQAAPHSLAEAITEDAQTSPHPEYGQPQEYPHHESAPVQPVHFPSPVVLPAAAQVPTPAFAPIVRAVPMPQHPQTPRPIPFGTPVAQENPTHFKTTVRTLAGPAPVVAPRPIMVAARPGGVIPQHSYAAPQAAAAPAFGIRQNAPPSWQPMYGTTRVYQPALPRAFNPEEQTFRRELIVLVSLVAAIIIAGGILYATFSKGGDSESSTGTSATKKVESSIHTPKKVALQSS